MTTPITAAGSVAKAAVSEVGAATEAAVTGAGAAAKGAPKAAHGFFKTSTSAVEKASQEVANARAARAKVAENLGIPAGHSSPALKVMFVASLGIIILIPVTRPETLSNAQDRSAWMRQLAAIALLFAVLLGLSNIGPGMRKVSTYVGGLFMLAIALTRRNSDGTLAALESFNALVRLLTPTYSSGYSRGNTYPEYSGRRRFGPGLNLSNQDVYGEGGGKNTSSTGSSESSDTDTTVGSKPVLPWVDKKVNTESPPTDTQGLGIDRKGVERPVEGGGLRFPQARTGPRIPYRRGGEPVVAPRSLFEDQLAELRGQTPYTNLPKTDAQRFVEDFNRAQDQKDRNRNNARKGTTRGGGGRPQMAK